MVGTSFLARGVDHHRASRVSNTHNRGARFKTRKTKRLFSRFVTYGHVDCWRRNSHLMEALAARTTLVNSVYLRKNVSGIQCFPNFKGNSIDRGCHRERVKDSQSGCKYGEWTENLCKNPSE